MKTLLLAGSLMLAMALPAIAAEEFYVALDTSTNKCHVMEQEPDGKTMMMVGGSAYKSEAEAQEAMQSLTACGR